MNLYDYAHSLFADAFKQEWDYEVDQINSIDKSDLTLLCTYLLKEKIRNENMLKEYRKRHVAECDE